jgi:hypothetical protein
MERIEITGDIWAALQIELSNLLISESFVNKNLHKEYSKFSTIYHYTSLKGLTGIIEKQCIYATHISFLNDRTEYKYSVDLMKNVVKKLYETKCNLEIYDYLLKNLQLLYSSERFVTCFSENGDLKSQWSDYANKGSGVSIGFDKGYFANSISQHIVPKFIDYDLNYQERLIEELILLIIRFFIDRKYIFNWEKYSFEQLVSNAILKFIDDILSAFKNPSFQEEQEFRFEHTIDGNMIKKDYSTILFREDGSKLIPYIELTTEYKNYLIQKAEEYRTDDDEAEPTFVHKLLPIKEIIVGPALEFEIVKFGINELLNKYGYENVSIKKSSVPLRT